MMLKEELMKLLASEVLVIQDLMTLPELIDALDLDYEEAFDSDNLRSLLDSRASEIKEIIGEYL